MPRSKLLFIVAIFSILVAPVLASPENPAIIRKEYRGKENTPDHMIFAFTLRTMALRYEANRELALNIVQEEMKLGSAAEAEEFLHRMFATGDDLADRQRMMKIALLCRGNSGQSKDDIYRAMDASDDVYEIIAKYAYMDFKATLDKDEKKNLKSWMDDEKEGYSYTSLDHSSGYESSGIDAITHVQQLCISYEQEQLRKDKK